MQEKRPGSKANGTTIGPVRARARELLRPRPKVTARSEPHIALHRAPFSAAPYARWVSRFHQGQNLTKPNIAKLVMPHNFGLHPRAGYVQGAQLTRITGGHKKACGTVRAREGSHACCSRCRFISGHIARIAPIYRKSLDLTKPDMRPCTVKINQRSLREAKSGCYREIPDGVT
jgi:hypothetical protein